MTDDEKTLIAHRFQLAIDCVDHARVCIREDLRGDMALKSLDMLEAQLQVLKAKMPAALTTV